MPDATRIPVRTVVTVFILEHEILRLQIAVHHAKRVAVLNHLVVFALSVRVPALPVPVFALSTPYSHYHYPYLHSDRIRRTERIERMIVAASFSE